MVIRKRSPSLKVVFFEYLFAMALMLVLALVIPYSLFGIGHEYRFIHLRKFQ